MTADDYRAGRGQDEDDVSSLAAVHAPVLRPLQTSDADVASLQAPHVGPEAIHVQICVLKYYFHTSCTKRSCQNMLDFCANSHQGWGVVGGDSQNAEPRLLVMDAGGSRRHTLDGLCQQVNCGQQQRTEATFHMMSETIDCHS